MNQLHLSLRQCTRQDAALLHEELGKDPVMWAYTGWNPYATLQSAEEAIERNLEEHSWIVERNGLPVGSLGAYDFSEEENTIEIGYSIFRPFWGKGLASEAVSLACRLLSKEGIAKAAAWTAEENKASRKVLEKNGFELLEVVPGAIQVEGHCYSQCRYGRRLKEE